MKNLKLLGFLMLAWVAAGCGNSVPEKAAATAPPMAVKLVQPTRGDITRSVSLPANIVANQQAALYAKVGGYLKTIAVDKGDSVKAGALLAEIEVPELIADQSRYQAEARLAEIDYQRIQEAQAKAPDLVVKQAIDQARAKFEVARANLERANTLLGFCKITAPFDGVITRRSVDPGAYIPAATSGSGAQTPALLTIADYSVVRAQVPVPEAEAPLVRNGLPATVTIEELPGKSYAGAVTRFSHALEDASKTMLAEVDLTNSDGRLLPGMYATTKLGVETHSGALLLPVDAVLVEKAGASVFTVVAGKAQRVPVRTGFNDGAQFEILDGIQATDSVILIGKRNFTNGQAVNVTP